MSDVVSNLALGLGVALQAQTLFYCLVGVTMGTLIGVLPGIGPIAAISIVLPITFTLDPTSAIVLISGLYYGANYGGSTASILLNLPGTPSSAVACLDGYPMARDGRAGVALFITTIASFIGSTICILLMTLLAPPLARVALSFGGPEFFAMMLLGLVAAATLDQNRPIRGMAMVVVGLMLGIVGTDPFSGAMRFTYGMVNLYDGLSLAVVAMGLFGVSEVIMNTTRLGQPHKKPAPVSWRSMIPSRAEVSASWPAILRGTGIGAWFGVLPGTGSSISSFLAYAVERRIARQPERFGKGAIEGVASPEAANNAATQAGFIPTMTLGIPGDAVMALIIGALMIHGIAPGPQTMTQHPELFWGLVASFWIGNFLLLFLNIPLIGIWIRALSIPYRILYPAILAFVCIGTYAVRNNIVDVYLVIGCGVAGFLLRRLGFNPAPLLLGFVLGPLIEFNLRRSMLLSRGDPMIFLERPISAFFVIVTALLLAYTLFNLVRRRGSGRISAGNQNSGGM